MYKEYANWFVRAIYPLDNEWLELVCSKNSERKVFRCRRPEAILCNDTISFDGKEAGSHIYIDSESLIIK